MDKNFLINILIAYGIKSQVVLDAIEKTAREMFVPDYFQDEAYKNYPLPIGYEQTISQPYIVARMTEIILKNNPQKILEIGTGSGYQAAVLSQLVKDVYTIERIEPLYEKAKTCFKKCGYKNIHTLFGDGFLGWQGHAPYDAIIVTASTPETPPLLLEQLKDHGQLLLPLGEQMQGQRLKLITKQGKTFTEETFDSVIFVPLLKGTQNK